MPENYARENSDSKNCKTGRNPGTKASDEVRSSVPMSKQGAAKRKPADCDR